MVDQQKMGFITMISQKVHFYVKIVGRKSMLTKKAIMPLIKIKK